MRILMLGNSFTFYNQMPSMLAQMTGAEVVHHTRGGAHLSEQLNPDTEMGAATLAALENQKWDYVVLQEMSRKPIKGRKKFLRNVKELCEKIRANGAAPVLYATWAYEPGSDKLEETGWTYEEMDQMLYDAYHEAAAQTGALVADVGRAFRQAVGTMQLYAPDHFHPSADGSRLAAKQLARVIMQHHQNG